ncbi:alpha/beta hydrolase [Variovorax sp. 22077]|uniref:alpha/beta hydrolase n=1 Tax=Variovorax sp. 22077 TaxID=3453867 RepID=UPI003F836489
MGFKDLLRTLASGGVLLLALTACGGGGGGGGGAALPIGLVTSPTPTTPTTPSTPSTTGRTTSDSIKSAQTGASYDLSIYLPPSYDNGSKAYPIIYALDGDAANPPSGRFANLKNILERRGVDAILIGIGGTARRSTDYTFPGAVSYHDFLTKELVPYIESKYRADVSKRMLTGHSLSGSMTGYVLFMEGANNSLTFSYFLSFEGAFGYQQPETDSYEQKMYDTQKGKLLPVTLVLARCGDTSSCNYVPVDKVYQKLLQRAYAGFTIVENTYSTAHVPTDLPAFEDAMAMIFK